MGVCSLFSINESGTKKDSTPRLYSDILYVSPWVCGESMFGSGCRQGCFGLVFASFSGGFRTTQCPVRRNPSWANKPTTHFTVNKYDLLIP
jgi:hypothetical protein